MALIYNASAEDQHFVVFGNHFNMKAGQIKNFEDKIAHFIITDRKELGLVGLTEEFDDPEFRLSEAGKEALAHKKAEGVANRVRKLKELVYNNQVSMRMDLEKANIQADPRAFASDGEIRAMELLAMYQDKEQDESKKKVQKIKELEAKIGKIDITK